MTPLALAWLRWIAYVLVGVSIILTGVAVSQLVKARRAPYYALRESARKRARRWMLIALMLQVVAVDLLILAPYFSRISRRSEEPPGTPPSPTLTAIATSTPRPSRTPTTTPTRRPTTTPPFIPTPTPDVPLPEPALSPLPSAVPAGVGARISVITLAADRDDSGQPVDPVAEFPPGDHRVYLFISYENMANGVAWTFAIYGEGELLDSSTQLWEWGSQGRTYLYYKPPGGYEPGEYEMRVFIEERLQGVAQFVIVEKVGE